jgi:hypothetical protein
MRTIVSALILLSVLAGVAGPASAACTVKGWTNGTTNQPIWECTDSNQ